MIKILTIAVVLLVATGSFAVDNKKRTDAIDSIGVVDVQTVDTIIGDGKHSRIKCIFADVGGNVKFKMKTGRSDGDTLVVVRTLNDATFYAISNIIKVYPLWNGTDSTTCQVYVVNGSTVTLVRGVCLGF